MADGDVVIRDFVTCVYEDDDGNTYRHKTFSFYQAQGSLGWVLNSSYTNKTLPRGYKMRTWLVQTALDHTQHARIPVATNAAYIAGTIGLTTIKVAYRGYELLMTLYAREGERHRGQTEDVAIQAALPG
jgi:hypothetical protein